MPLQATSGAASYDGFGGGVPFEPTYIEQVFATHLYTGNGSTGQSITNGIDLSTKGGLVWTKARSSAFSHGLVDTARGATNTLVSNLTDASTVYSTVTAFNTNGFTVGSSAIANQSGDTYASWTFRKQPKFFDVVTYTGTGSSQTISHNLGSTPGCIIIKKLDSTTYNAGWAVYHRSLTNPSQYYLRLDTTSAETNYGANFISGVGSTTFTVEGGSGFLGLSGSTYVAYLFAHNAGGFGLTGTDNVVSCGSFTTPSSGDATITLGYEPQWLLVKRTNGSSDWYMVDTMRGLAQTFQARLDANLSSAEETTTSPWFKVTATGFTASAASIGGSTPFIYIAIRRGPMKTPTTGTSVYENVAYTGNATANRQIGSSVLMDAMLLDNRDATAQSWSTYGQMFFDRLRGDDVSLATASTAAQSTGWQTYFDSDMNVGWDTGTTTSQDYLNKSGATFVSHIFRRAPGFFDVVCYTGTGSATTQAHNLGVVPELMITKRRDANNSWPTFFNMGVSSYRRGSLNLTDTPLSLAYNAGFGLSSAPTSTAINLDSGGAMNGSGGTYVAYLFASCPGVSKVGSYTGTGTTLQIDCGFTGGARFVLIRRTDDAGDWYCWDSSRGIVSGNDPYLLLNSTAAEVTNTDYIDTYSAGFEISSTAPAAINANGGSFVFLAIS
jgi:hypothetical protein